MLKQQRGARRPANRTARPGLALAAGLLLAATAVAAARADVTTTIVSGLGWRSGTNTGGYPCIADLRGRPLDVLNVYLAPPGFPQMVQNSGAWVQRYGSRAPLLVVSMALVPANNKGQFAQCAAGAFDGYFRQIGANLQGSPAQGVVVRLGWEANLGSGLHPWGLDGDAQAPAWRQCWRHAALALKAGGPRLQLEWTISKKTQNRALHVLGTGPDDPGMYPGDDVVDHWGTHQYDAWPLKNTQALWDQYYMATYNGTPWGIGAWLAEAQKHGKQLAVGEWGIKQLSNQTAAQADDPVFTDNMYRFFRDHAAGIAYESYFNATTASGGHALCPGTSYPRAAATYKQDWGR
jgi:hypothetical protein